MTTCPSCGAAEDRQQEPPPTRRTHYGCGSYATDNHTTHQSDLCFANQRIRNVRNLAITDGESAAQLLARVKELISA